jgi:zinc transport system ATP-binding protein
MTSEVHVDSVTVAYGRHRAVEDVDLTLRSREILALVGPNGGGKSTLLKAILGLVPLSSGRIDIRGQSPRPGLDGLGYVPQSGSIDIDFPLTVREVLGTGLLTHRRFWTSRLASRRGRSIVEDVLDRLNLGSLADRPIGDLSGGQRQRVLIGRALACQPRVLLLDEPTSHLDPRAREDIYTLLTKLTDTTTILLVSHDVDQVEQVADRVARLDGRLTWSDSCCAHGLPFRAPQDSRAAS